MERHMMDVIIVNYKSTHRLLRCLESFAGDTTRTPVNVIVYDNTANNGIGFVQKKFPQVTVLHDGRNLGFARAANKALAESASPYVTLLNPDTIVPKGFFSTVLSYMEGHGEVGIAGPAILNPDGSVQGSARSFPNALTGLFGRGSVLTRLFPKNRISRANILTDRSEGGAPIEVDWVSGACMVVRREAIDQVGPLDQRFFLYWEDADWCKRMRAKGWKVVYFPVPRVVHYVGASSSQRIFRSILDFHVSAYKLFCKYSNSSAKLASPLVACALASRFVLTLVMNWVGRSIKK
jgi:GT2 family glycosyltransferase